MGLRSCNIFSAQAAARGASKKFLECPIIMIIFPCQKGAVVDVFTYFQTSHTTNSLSESSAPILFLKNPKNSHLSLISDLHALYIKSKILLNDSSRNFLKIYYSRLTTIFYFMFRKLKTKVFYCIVNQTCSTTRPVEIWSSL